MLSEVGVQCGGAGEIDGIVFVKDTADVPCPPRRDLDR